MISATEKEFWFRKICSDVLNYYYAACYDPTGNKLSVSHRDLSRMHSYEVALWQLRGLCIPYQYGIDLDEKELKIRIYSNSNNKVYLEFKRGDSICDL